MIGRRGSNLASAEDYTPIRLRLKGDLLIFSLKLRSPEGKTTLEVENNEFTVNMPGCDWNYNANALEMSARI